MIEGRLLFLSVTTVCLPPDMFAAYQEKRMHMALQQPNTLLLLRGRLLLQMHTFTLIAQSQEILIDCVWQSNRILRIPFHLCLGCQVFLVGC